MLKTAMIRARMEPKLKNEVEKIFRILGLTSTEAINLFYKQVKIYNGIPFEIKVPNKQTLKAFRDSDAGKNLKKFKSIDDLLTDLNT